jgi:hypothetical protein
MRTTTIQLLAMRLNAGVEPASALAILEIDPDTVSTEHECLALDDPDNAVIDLCDGTMVQRIGDTWRALTY